MLVVLTARFQARTVSGSMVLSLLPIRPGYQPGLPAKGCIGNRQLQGSAAPSHHRYRTPIRFRISSMAIVHILSLGFRGSCRSHLWRLWSRRCRIRGRSPCAGAIAVAGFQGWTIIGEEFIARLYDGGHEGPAPIVMGLNNPHTVAWFHAHGTTLIPLPSATVPIFSPM